MNSKKVVTTQAEIQRECNRHFREGAEHVIKLIRQGIDIKDIEKVIRERKSKIIAMDAIAKAMAQSK